MSQLHLVSQANLNIAYSTVNACICPAENSEHINHKHITHAAIKQLRCCGELDEVWHKGNPEEEHKQKLISAVHSIVVNAHSPWKPCIKAFETQFQSIFFDLLRGNFPALPNLSETFQLLKAIFWKKDEALLKEGKALINILLEDIFVSLNEAQLSAEQSLHLEVIIGDLLALFPFLSPEEGQTLQVPVLINGNWHQIKYHVKEIAMTPLWMGSPLVAYGLTPQNQTDAYSFPPLLLYKGTTYPTDKGFILSLITDFNMFASIGYYAFYIAKDTIEEWLTINTDNGKNKAHIYGKSLGGAQSRRTALYFPHLTNKVMAYGAPGPSSDEINQLNSLLEEEKAPKIYMFSQENDPVPYLGKIALRGIEYFKVISQSIRVGPAAHADIASTHEHSCLLRVEPQTEIRKWTRLGLNTLRETLSIVIFPPLLVSYIGLQAIRLVVQSLVQSIKSLSLLVVRSKR